MHIFIEKEDKTIEKSFKGKVGDLLSQIDVNPETVIIVRDGALITEEDHVDDTDNIKLLSVLSGG